MKLCLHPEAEQSINDIVHYLGSRSRTVAAKFHGSLLAAIRRAQLFPNSGQLIGDGSRIRKRQIFLGGCYRLAYCIDERRKSLWILSVAHEASLLHVPELPTDARG